MRTPQLRRVTPMVAVVGSLCLALSAAPASGTPNQSAHSSISPAVAPAVRSDDTVGTWRVSQLRSGLYRLRWVSPTTIPVTDARPEIYRGGAFLGAPLLEPDGRTLTLDVRATAPPRVASLDVRLSGQALDERAAPAEPQGTPSTYTPQPDLRSLTADPGVPGAHETVSSDYQLRSTKIPGLAAEVEMVGHVVRPVDADPQDPLVLFLHGKHQFCFDPDDPFAGDGTWPCNGGTRPVPSHLGYDYMQRLLASQGYVTVSIAANGINAQDFLPDSGAQARATLIRRHLSKWSDWVAAGKFTADMRNVVLVGHSRGGEGVNKAALVSPLSAPYRITGLVLIAPTSFTRQATPYVPTVSLLPYCDGDVVGSDGQTYVDLARDLAADDTALRSAAMILGANHNFFNTEWTPGLSAAPSGDDWGGAPNANCGTATPERLTAAEQRRVGKAYVAGAVHLFAAHDQTVLPMFDGSRVNVPSAGGADVRTHAINGDRTLLKPRTDITVGAVNDATALICAGYAKPGLVLARVTQQNCGRGISSIRTPHWPSSFLKGIPTLPAIEMSWAEPGSSAALDLDTPLDLSSANSLDLRTIVDTGTGDVRLKVRLLGASGGVLVTPAGGSLLPALPVGPLSLSKRWAQTLRVPLSGVTGVNLSAIAGIELVGLSDDGRVWVLDAAAVGDRLAAVPDKRAPRISIGDVRTIEGDGPGNAAMSVPFTITGDVSSPSRVVVLSRNLSLSANEQPKAVFADLPAGTRSGVLTVPYTPDERDDLRVQRFEFNVYGVRGIVADDFSAVGRLVDDDPAPTVRIRRFSPVTEGDPARWKVRLSAPVDYVAIVGGRVVANPTDVTPLRVGDVPKRWREGHVFNPDNLAAPLHTEAFPFSEAIRAGQVTGVLTVPTRLDTAQEGREAVSMRVRVQRLADPETLTVMVRDPA